MFWEIMLSSDMFLLVNLGRRTQMIFQSACPVHDLQQPPKQSSLVVGNSDKNHDLSHLSPQEAFLIALCGRLARGARILPSWPTWPDRNFFCGLARLTSFSISRKTLPQRPFRGLLLLEADFLASSFGSTSWSVMVGGGLQQRYIDEQTSLYICISQQSVINQ